MHAMDYYLALKKEILLFVTIWMKLEGIMLNEIFLKTKKEKVNLMETVGK